jgi:hypothetical protein
MPSALIRRAFVSEISCRGCPHCPAAVVAARRSPTQSARFIYSSDNLPCTPFPPYEATGGVAWAAAVFYAMMGRRVLRWRPSGYVAALMYAPMATIR